MIFEQLPAQGCSAFPEQLNRWHISFKSVPSWQGKGWNLLNSAIAADKWTSFLKEKSWEHCYFLRPSSQACSHRLYLGAPCRVCRLNPTAAWSARPQPLSALTSCILCAVKVMALFPPRSSTSASSSFSASGSSSAQCTMQHLSPCFFPQTNHWTLVRSHQHPVQTMEILWELIVFVKIACNLLPSSLRKYLKPASFFTQFRKKTKQNKNNKSFYFVKAEVELTSSCTSTRHWDDGIIDMCMHSMGMMPERTWLGSLLCIYICIVIYFASTR